MTEITLCKASKHGLENEGQKLSEKNFGVTESESEDVYSRFLQNHAKKKVNEKKKESEL